MSPSMDWLYSYYIMPIIEGTPPGEYAENIARLKAALDIPLEMDLERMLEWYASIAFRLGLRTGLALQELAADE